MTMRPFFPIAALAALTLPAAASASFDGRDVRTTVVHVGDLDLASGWGVDRTIRRLRSAIDGLCDEDEACRDEAWLSADWQVARDMADAQWRRRIAEERFADREHYGWRGDDREMMPPVDDWGALPPPAPVELAPPPAAPGPAPIASVTTTTTTTTTTVTTITLAYRTPPPDYGWYPR